MKLRMAQMLNLTLASPRERLRWPPRGLFACRAVVVYKRQWRGRRVGPPWIQGGLRHFGAPGDRELPYSSLSLPCCSDWACCRLLGRPGGIGRFRLCTRRKLGPRARRAQPAAAAGGLVPSFRRAGDSDRPVPATGRGHSVSASSGVWGRQGNTAACPACISGRCGF